jgi:propionyl-CoA synthetase
MAASCGLEPGRIVQYKPLLDGAIEISNHKPQSLLMLQRKELQAAMITGRDVDWQLSVDAAKAGHKKASCVPLKATDPLYVLYTSGTTGIPKGVVRDNGGHMVALYYSMHALYGVEAGDVYWAASDVGWVVGHSYIVYAPLLKGCTTILYEGKPVGTPDAGAFWRVISEHKVKVLFTAPTAFRAIKKEDSKAEFMKNYDMSAFKMLFLAGERADPDTINWAQDILGTPVVDHWWQTETGWCIVGNPAGLGLLPIKPGSPTVPMPGYDVQVVDEGGKAVARGKMGSIVVKLPLPPGAFPTLWQNDDRFKESYLSAFPGYYNTSDAGYIDEEGYLYVMGRTDDIINVAGHRLSTGGMEEVLSSHPDVAETAVLGMVDSLKGEVPLGFIVLKKGVTKSNEQVEKECVALVRDKIGPVAAFKLAVTISRLPKTRSGKILRGTMKKIADRQEFSTPATIDDPMILTEISDALKAKGII